MPKTTHTRSKCVIRIAFPLQQWLQECAHCCVIVCIVVLDGAKRHAESRGVAMFLRRPSVDGRQGGNVYVCNRVHICSDARPCAYMVTWSSFLVVRDVIHNTLRLKMRTALLPRGMVPRHGSSVPIYDKCFRSTKGHECAEMFLLKSNLGVDAKCDKGLMVLAEVY